MVETENDSQPVGRLMVEDPFDRDIGMRTMTWVVSELALPSGSDHPEVEAVCRRLGAVMPEDQAGTVVVALLRAQRALIDELTVRAGSADQAIEVRASEIAELRYALESMQDSLELTRSRLKRLRRRNRALRRKVAELDNARSIRAARAVKGRIRRTRARLAGVGVRADERHRDGTG